MAKQSIKAEIELDPTKAVSDASRASKKIHDEMGKASKSGGDTGGAAAKQEKTSSALLGTAMKTAVAFAAVAKAVEAAVSRNSQFNQMSNGIASVLPPTELVAEEIQKLRNLATQPGLEFDSIVTAHKRFLALNQSADASRELIGQIGNALKLSGMPAESIVEVANALAQTDADGRAVVGTLHEMTKTSVVFRNAFKAGFGTDSLRELEGMRLSSDQFVTGFSKGLSTLKTASGDAGDVIKNMKSAFGNLATDISNWAVNGVTNLVGGTPTPDRKPQDVTAVKEDNSFLERRQKRLQKIQDEIDLEWDLNYARSREADLFARIESDAPSKTDELRKQYEQQKEKTDSAAAEFEIRKNLLDVMKNMSLTEAEAEAHIREKIRSARELSNQQEKDAKQQQRDEQAKTLALRDRDNQIAAAEAGGHTKRAERMKREADVQDKTKELEMLGMDSKSAEAMAREEVRIKRDQEYRDRTGRSRSHGIKSPKEMGGISDGQNYAGLNYLKKSPGGRVGDQNYASLDKMAALQAESGRRKVATSVPPPAPRDNAAELIKAQTALKTTLDNVVTLIAPMAKKYAASDLNQ